jgi:hypothetical protein
MALTPELESFLAGRNASHDLKQLWTLRSAIDAQISFTLVRRSITPHASRNNVLEMGSVALV